MLCSLRKMQLEQILEECIDDEAYEVLDSELWFVTDASDEEDKVLEEESKQFDNPVINKKYYGKDGTK